MKYRLPRLLWAGAVVLLANSAYLAAYGSPNLFYIGNVVFHLLFGAGMGVLFLIFSIRYLKGAYGPPSNLARAGVGVLLLSLVFAGYSALFGTTQPDRWALYGHIVTVVVGLAIVGVAVYGQVLAAANGGRARWAIRGTAALFLASIAFPVGAEVYRERLSDAAFAFSNPELPPASPEEEGAGRSGHFFPASAETATGEIITKEFLMSSQTCRPCHDDIVDQWESSAHRHSSFNNQWYRKSIEYMQEVLGTEASKWCGGCHDAAVLFNGMMDRSVKEIVETPQANAGLHCTACHSIIHVKSSMGNSDYVIEYPPMHDMVNDENPFMHKLHDYLVKLDPEPHKQGFLKPIHRGSRSEFCSACHKVHLDKPVNNYRWFRGFNEYDAWQNSGVSHNNARAFYYPPKPRECNDCHMPLVPSEDLGNIDGFVHDHSFPAANTALPFVNGDEAHLKKVTQFLQNGQVTVDIFGFSRATDEETFAAPEVDATPREASLTATEGLGIGQGGGAGATDFATLVGPLGEQPVAVKKGETYRVDVVVRTRNVGHFFPGGTIDAFDVWVELKAEDDRGKTLFWSGWVEEHEGGRKGPVDPSAHRYGAKLLDARGNPIDKRNAWAARSVLFARAIPPGAADVVHFRLQVPEDAGSRITLTAKLNYRKFTWWNTQFAYAGVRDPDQGDYEVTKDFDDGKWVFTGDTSKVSGKLKEIPDLPIVVMSEDTAVLDVVAADAEPPDPAVDASDGSWERWNDFGIALLLQGDFLGAEQAFGKVTEMRPDYAKGWVNVARPRVLEGLIDEAREPLEKAIAIDPEDAGAHYFLGLTAKREGEYDRALEHFRAATSKFPRDRVVLNEIGRVLFLKKQYAEAIEALKQVLAIDPEDLRANYTLMLCYRGLRDPTMSAKHMKLYQRFKLDESAQSITGEVRRTSPHDNNERLAIHEHSSLPPVTRDGAIPEKE